MATLSLLMAPATVIAGLIAGATGSFLQFVVFDLDEQHLLYEAGVWGYAAASFLLILIVIPASVGIVLGAGAWRLGEPRLGTTGLVVNALVASYLIVTAVSTILLA